MARMRRTSSTIEYIFSCRIDMNSNEVADFCMVHGCIQKEFAGVVCTTPAHGDDPCYAFICDEHAAFIGAGRPQRYMTIAYRHSSYTQCLQRLEGKHVIDGDVLMFTLEDPRIET